MHILYIKCILAYLIYYTRQNKIRNCINTNPASALENNMRQINTYECRANNIYIYTDTYAHTHQTE